MDYTIRDLEDRFELILHAPTSRITVLEMKPSRQESILREGLWLILQVAVWSGPDLKYLKTFLHSADSWPQWIKLGVRLFDENREAATWCPSIQGVYGSPVWVAMRDGETLGHLVGMQPLEKVTSWLADIRG